jgi:hypothetical protein
MFYYPQLSSGSASQYPIKRHGSRRTVVNQMEDGSNIRMEDAGALRTIWNLTYSGLTDDELGALRDCFEAAEGQLASFTFLDPADNLLLWSEDFTHTVWKADPLLTIAAGGADPQGGATAFTLTNTAQISQRLWQAVAGASWYQYCLSAYVRSAALVTARLLTFSAGGLAAEDFGVGSAWKRVASAKLLTAREDGVSFGIELPAGAQIEVFGPQAEAQPGPGLYRKTTDRAGVYSEAFFEQDELILTTKGPNQHACVAQIGAVR